VLGGFTVTKQGLRGIGQDIQCRKDCTSGYFFVRLELYRGDHCTQCWLTAIGLHPFRKCTEKPTRLLDPQTNVSHEPYPLFLLIFDCHY